MKICIFLGLIILVTSQQSFSYWATYTCTANGNKICSAWTLSMSLQQNVGCFPSTQKVITDQGIKTMQQLKIGDRLLGYDQEFGLVYTPIKSWMHKLQGSQYIFKYQKISTETGSFHISAMHNIGISNSEGQLDYLFAKDIKRYHQLFGNNSSILSNQQQMKPGLYAPLTSTFNFYLVISQQSNAIALVHSFAHIANPIFFQNIYYYIQLITQSLGIFSDIPNKNGISQLNLFLMRLFPNVFIEKPIIQNMNTKDGQLVRTYSSYSSSNSNSNNQLEYQVEILTSYLIFAIQNTF